MPEGSPTRIAVIGGGISGLAAAHRLVTSAPPGAVEVTVLEASDRFGGWIRTEAFAGRPVDFGPDSLLVRTPWATELCRELGIEDELVAPGGGGAYLWSRGRLRTLPSGILAGLPNGPMPFVKSGLLSPLGIARAALDLMLPGNAPEGDESIGELVRRRLGSEALERVVDPLLGGVHAGRCDDLSLAATAPQIAAAARADRSLLRGLRATAPKPPAAGAPAAPVFMGPRLGMARLVEALLGALDGKAVLRLGAVVESIAPGGGPSSAGAVATRSGPETAEPQSGPETDEPQSVVALATQECGSTIRVAGDAASLVFDGVILAVPAPAAARLLEPHIAQAARPLTELAYASVAHVALSFKANDVPPLPPGTGFLVPRPEETLMTACTLLDQKWPGRTADGSGDGTVVIKCSVGRIDDERFQRLSDEAIVAALGLELSGMLGIHAAPVAHRIMRVKDGLPQYRPGHLDRMDGVVKSAAGALPGVTLTGAACRGTSVPVCIREGRAAADAQLALRPIAP